MTQYKTSGEEWIIRFRPVTTPRLRLFCFPYAGGSAALFRAWANPGVLPDGVEICALELPGHGVRREERLLTRFSDVVDATVETLYPFTREIPFALFGHSLGALLCFEVARMLQESYDLHAHHLFVSACRAPHLPDELPSIKTVSQLMNYLRTLGSQPDESMIARRWPLFQADFTLRKSYHYTDRTLLTCPITAFGGEQDSEVSIADMDAWRGHTQSHYWQYLFPGNHFFLHTAQEQVLQQIAHDLPHVGSCLKEK